MRRDLEGDMAFDGGAIIELVYATPAGTEIKEAIKSRQLRPFVTELAMAEASYILCRKLGSDEASSRMKDLRESNTIAFVPITQTISDTAALYKCERSISLADCFSIALGKSKAIPVLFARREEELEKEMRAHPFDVELIFLGDLSLQQ